MYHVLFFLYQVSTSKYSQSETCLNEQQRSPISKSTPVKKTSVSSGGSPTRDHAADEETYSTDSNSTVDDDIRRKKRKLFPTFARKHKTKTS